MEMPKDRTDMQQWTHFFMRTRQEVLKTEGRDIADDHETMWGWFVNVYQNGYDEAQVQRMFADAGVDNIEDYMKTLVGEKIED